MDYRQSAMDLWYRKMPGSALVDMEREQLEGLLSHIFGDHLLQIGGPSDMSLVSASPIGHKLSLGLQSAAPSNVSFIQANFLEFPIMPNSMDVVVLAHLLEFIEDPQAVLQEIHHALVPNGQLIVVGFNPWSLWNVLRLKKNKCECPWDGKFWSPAQVKRWLRAMGYSIVTSKTLCFRPPMSDYQWYKRLLYLEAVGQLCAPGCGAVYLIAAQKKVVGMTPLKVNGWSKKYAVNNGYVEPTTRNIPLANEDANLNFVRPKAL